MDKFIEFFYYLVYDAETANYYWHNDSVECCMRNGFYTLLACAFVTAAFFYFYWSNVKIFEHATLKSWLLNGLCGMGITFIASEIIVAYFSQLEGVQAYIGDSGCDILVFSLYNATVGFAIVFTIMSTVMQLLSKNAKNIPWHFYKV
jgi:hypothetical protein